MAYNPYSNYNGNSDNAGGFNTGGNGSQYGNPTSAGSGTGSQTRKPNRATVRPITIRQLNQFSQDTPDGPFSLDGQEISMISLVGVVRAINTLSSNTSIKLEDGTAGQVDIKQWHTHVNDDESSLPKEEFAVGEYVYIVGEVRVFNQRRSVNSQVIRRVTDHNQVIYHQLSAVKVSLSLSLGPPTEKSGGMASFNAGNNSNKNNNTITTANGLFIDNQLDYSKEGSESQRIMFLLKKMDDEGSGNGIHCDDIAVGLGMDSKRCKVVLQQLYEEGTVTCVDDEMNLFAPIE